MNSYNSSDHLQDHTFRILLVDDNPKNIQVLGNALQEESCELEFALDGQAALDWLRESSFDLILLDINMPGTNGFDVCKKIRSDKRLDSMPVIFLSALSDRESILKGFELGAQDFITKPFEKRELLARVHTQLEIKRSRDSISSYLTVIEKKNKLINESIRYAQSIQNAVQKSSQKCIACFQDSFTISLPKDMVSGDFSYFHKLDTSVLVGVFDGTGHGIPGALISMLGISMLNEIIVREKFQMPDAILERLREQIVDVFGQKGETEELKDGMDGTIISYDAVSKTIYFAGAYAFGYLVQKGEIIEMKGDMMPLAYHPRMTKFSMQTFQVEEGDIIYLFSDGYSDQFGGPLSKKYGRKRFRETLEKYQHHPLKVQRILLRDTLLEWRGKEEQTDDVTIVGVRI